jgi:signal transduction histidine kinase
MDQKDILLLIALGAVMMTVLALTLVLFYVFSQRKLFQVRTAQQNLKIEHQQTLTRSILQTEEKERRRIAKDLHDDIGSKLNVVLLYLHRIEKKANDQNFTELLKETKGLINATIQSSRDISHNLLPPTLDKFGLRAALIELVEQYNQSNEVSIQLELPETFEFKAGKGKEIHFYRAIQELIKNSVTHGNADSISIKLYPVDQQLFVDYQDSGKGFDLSSVQSQGDGLGLQNIESRLQVLNSEIEYQTTPGKGVFAQIRPRKPQKELTLES